MEKGYSYDFSYQGEREIQQREEILLYRVERSHEPERQTQEASCNERISNSHD
jgi:hypothetical protein